LQPCNVGKMAAAVSSTLPTSVLAIAQAAEAHSAAAWLGALPIVLFSLIALFGYRLRLRRDRKRLSQALRQFGEHPDVNEISSCVGQLTTSEFRNLAQACQAVLQRSQATIAGLDWSTRHDPDTGLLNMVGFRQACLARLADEHAPEGASLIVVGLEGLRKMGESLGAQAHDTMLRAAADRLHLVAAASRENKLQAMIEGQLPTIGDAILGRLHSEELAMFVPMGQDNAIADKLAQRLIRVMGEPMQVGQHSMRIRPAIGLAHTKTSMQEPFEELLFSAELALSHARAQGPSHYQAYEPQMRRETDTMLERELELRNALSCGEFCLHYQPQVSMATGRVESVEALIRWNHPTRGLIMPGEFIAFAEMRGLIDDLGDWVLREATRCAAGWYSAGYPLRVSVNVSPSQLGRVELIPMIRATLNRYGLPPRLLEIEITEAAILHNGEFSSERIEGLRRDGVSVALDDFGTGYSNLAQLMGLPMDRLKLDRSLLDTIATDRRQQVMASCTIAMARDLGFEVVAEGVETLEQLELLRAFGCDIVQGYYFSRPLAEADLFARIREIGKSTETQVA